MLINDETNVIYNPFKVLIIYKEEGNLGFDKDYYIESADIVKGNIKSQRPLTNDEFLNLMAPIKQASKQNNLDYYLPLTDKNVISYTNKDSLLNLTWVVKSHQNNFIFGRTKKVNKLNYPNMIFNIKGNTFRIVCFKGSFKGNNTKLYKAPFPNIYEDNSMCFGNINIKSLFNNDLNQTMINFENAFFNSGFNALESTERTKSNTFELLKRLMKSGDKFPTKELVPLKIKLKNAIS